MIDWSKKVKENDEKHDRTYKGKLDRYLLKQKVIYAALCRPDVYLSCQTLRATTKRCNQEQATSYADLARSISSLSAYTSPNPEFFQYVESLGYPDLAEWIRKVDAAVID